MLLPSLAHVVDELRPGARMNARVSVRLKSTHLQPGG
jgi:hypothetical protein